MHINFVETISNFNISWDLNHVKKVQLMGGTNLRAKVMHLHL